MYNVTLRIVLVIIVAAQNEKLMYSEFMFVALVIEHEMCMRHIVTCGLSACTVSFNIIS